jgi:hypothetical protein
MVILLQSMQQPLSEIAFKFKGFVTEVHFFDDVCILFIEAFITEIPQIQVLYSL